VLDVSDHVLGSNRSEWTSIEDGWLTHHVEDSMLVQLVDDFSRRHADGRDWSLVSIEQK